MKNLFSNLKAAAHRESGASMVEYAILVALISIVSISAITATGFEVRCLFERTAAALSGVTGSGFTVSTECGGTGDNTPDPFNVTFPGGPFPPSTTVTSDPFTVAGFDNSETITVDSGCTLIINGTNVGATGTVSPGDTVEVECTSSPNPGETINPTVSVGGQSDDGDVTTEDNNPDAFTLSFPGGPFDPSTSVTSDSVTVSGVDGTVTASVDAGCTLTINGTDTGTDSATVQNSDTVEVVCTSGPNFDDSIPVTLTIGDGTSTDNVVTRSVDSDPDAFDLNFPGGPFAPSTTVTSDTITVGGIEGTVAITVDNSCTLTINGTDTGSDSSTVQNGDTVEVVCTSGPNLGDSFDVTLNIGDGSDQGTVANISQDADPDAFTLTFPDGPFPGDTPVDSDPITVTGITDGVAISVDQGCTLTINGTDTGSNSSTVNNNDTVIVNCTSPSTNGTSIDVTLTIGNGTSTDSILTDLDPDPDAFDFEDFDCPTPIGQFIETPGVTLTGFTESTVTVSGADEATVVVNGTDTGNASAPITLGDTVAVRFRTLGTSQATTTVTITVGSVTDTITATNAIPGQIAAPFWAVVQKSDTCVLNNTFQVTGLVEAYASLDRTGPNTPVQTHLVRRLNNGVATTADNGPATSVNVSVVFSCSAASVNSGWVFAYSQPEIINSIQLNAASNSALPRTVGIQYSCDGEEFFDLKSYDSTLVLENYDAIQFPTVPFDFDDVTNAEPDFQYSATLDGSVNPVTLNGVSAGGVTATLSGDANATLAKNGVDTGATTATYVQGDTISIIADAPSGFSETKTLTVTIGAFAADWTITTRPSGPISAPFWAASQASDRCDQRGNNSLQFTSGLGPEAYGTPDVDVGNELPSTTNVYSRRVTGANSFPVAQSSLIQPNPIAVNFQAASSCSNDTVGSGLVFEFSSPEAVGSMAVPYFNLGGGQSAEPDQTVIMWSDDNIYFTPLKTYNNIDVNASSSAILYEAIQNSVVPLTFENVTQSSPSTQYFAIDSNRSAIEMRGIGVNPLTVSLDSGAGGATIFKNNADTGGTTTTVVEGDFISVQTTTDSGFSAARNLTITAGDQSQTWTLTNRAAGQVSAQYWAALSSGAPCLVGTNAFQLTGNQFVFTSTNGTGSNLSADIFSRLITGADNPPASQTINFVGSSSSINVSFGFPCTTDRFGSGPIFDLGSPTALGSMTLTSFSNSAHPVSLTVHYSDDNLYYNPLTVYSGLTPGAIQLFNIQ